MEKLFEDSFVTLSRILSTLGPGVTTSIDIYQTTSDAIIKASFPGIKPEEVDITITGDTLSIKGETKAEEKVKRENYLQLPLLFLVQCHHLLHR